MTEQVPYPIDIQVLQKQHHVLITFSDTTQAKLDFAYLRANSPSAEHKGHGHVAIVSRQQCEDRDVNIIEAEPIGNYAIKFVFDDGHRTGLYTWAYLYALAVAS